MTLGVAMMQSPRGRSKAVVCGNDGGTWDVKRLRLFSTYLGTEHGVRE